MNFDNETYFHINFEDPFTRVPNAILDNKNLTYSAIGVVTQMLRFQKSGSHKIYAKSLISYRKDSKSRISSALNELMNEGFVIRSKIRNDKGQIKGYRYDIFDIPQIKIEEKEDVKSQPCFNIPNTVNSEIGKPGSEKTGDSKTEIQFLGNIKENSIKENNNTIITINKEQEESAYIKKYFEKYIGVITPNNFLELLGFLDDGMEVDVIIRAIDEATSNGVKNYRYIKTILNNWIEVGIKTNLDLTEYQNEYKKKKRKSNSLGGLKNDKQGKRNSQTKSTELDFNSKNTRINDKELERARQALRDIGVEPRY
ncbi:MULTISPECIES: DnaD domain protein [unclassified Clostridioides]|uniref:DnaD domain-containing protein n=1 Tax=unclassified Clostridioides TaxID=2635829 RepID=UPI001FAE1736|nr:DnaD domain protein [Clostridioides difficile]